MSSTTKIAVYSLPDLKSTTDDVLPNYLNSLKFRRTHRLGDVRLVLGYVVVAIAGALFYFDYKLGWDATKPCTGPAVALYFLLNGALTYWIWMVEKGCIYEGETKDGVKIRIHSRTEKHSPVYHLTVRLTPSPSAHGASLPEEIRLSAPFARWFSADGRFVAKPFQQFLASGIPPVGAADPQNVVEEIGRGSRIEEAGSTTTTAAAAETIQGVYEFVQREAAAKGKGKARRKT